MPGPGLLAIEVDTPEGVSDKAWWELLELPCGSRAKIVDRSLSTGLMELSRAGEVHLLLGRLTETAEGDQDSVRVVTRYLATADLPTIKDGESGDDTESEDSEIQPTPPPTCPATGQPGPCGKRLIRDGESGDDTESEDSEIQPNTPPPVCPGIDCPSNPTAGNAPLIRDGESGDDTESEDSEIQPKSPSAKQCGRGEPGNDLIFCARHLTLGTMVEAELLSPYADDRDYYTFELSHAQTVRLTTEGRIDTYGTLYDAWGKELSSADDGGGGENFGLSAQLAQGQYFLRVEGRGGSEGAYRLHLRN